MEDDGALLLVHFPLQLHHGGTNPPVDGPPLHALHLITAKKLDTALEESLCLAIDYNLSRLDRKHGWRELQGLQEQAW